MAKTLSPLDESGKPVDWWFLYKVPKLSAGPGVTSATGYEYVYYDRKVAKVAQSPNVLTDGKGALDLTLASAFQNPSATTGWVLYNDEVPASANRKDDGDLGHTKGVIAFDTASKTAFWLLHSWPKYADPHAGDSMPTPDYGQTYMCIAIDLATASKLATQMASFQEPQTFLPHLPPSLSTSDPLYRLTQTLNANTPADSGSADYTSRGGLHFKVIAKNRLWGKDFWNDLVGPTLKETMDVETWIRGKIPPIQDSDGVHKTFDVKFIDLRPLGAPWAWPESHDHAKWGLSVADNWMCVGDINRMVSQEKRGGGTIAFQDATLWAAMKKTDLVVPPPGQTKKQAMDLIKTTQAGAGGKQAKAKPAPKTKTTKTTKAKKKSR